MNEWNFAKLLNDVVGRMEHEKRVESQVFLVVALMPGVSFLTSTSILSPARQQHGGGEINIFFVQFITEHAACVSLRDRNLHNLSKYWRVCWGVAVKCAICINSRFTVKFMDEVNHSIDSGRCPPETRVLSGRVSSGDLRWRG